MPESRKIVTLPILRLLPNAKFERGIYTIAHRMGWHSDRFIEGDDEIAREVTFRTPYPGTTVHWIDDPRTGVSYVAIGGDARNDVADQLSGTSGFYSLGELLQMARDATAVADKMRAAYYLSLAAPDVIDAEIFALFARYLEDAEAEVRGATVLAISYMGWPEFMPLLERRMREDPDATIREDAAILLENMRKYPPRSLILS